MNGVLRGFALISERQQGSFQQGAGVGAGDAGVGEHADRSGGIVDTHAEGM